MKLALAPFARKWGLTPFLVLLASCGFHLQGRQPLPAQFSHTYVDTKDEQTDFVQDLRKALISSKVNVIPTKNSSTAVIEVHEDELTERILSVSAQNIPTEYELTYKVTFSVTSEGKTLIDKEETLFVIKGSDADASIPHRFPNKKIRHVRAGRNSGIEMRQEDAADHLGVARAEIEGRLFQSAVEALQPRQHQQHHESGDIGGLAQRREM